MILWGKEHQARAEALAIEYNEKAMAEARLARSNSGIQPVTCADLTLSIWGHGNEIMLAGMLDVELGVLIQNWKRKNPSLKTVELITCNAQHNSQPLSGYAKRVAKFVERNYKDITIKALPAGQFTDDYSILWANANTKTFCYITAPSKETFDFANKRLQALEPVCHNDLVKAGQQMAKERGTPPHNYTVNYGCLNVLRASLATV
jgi:hypothetical protein